MVLTNHFLVILTSLGLFVSGDLRYPSSSVLTVCDLLLFYFKDFIYVFMRDSHREAETQAEGEAGSLQEA